MVQGGLGVRLLFGWFTLGLPVLRRSATEGSGEEAGQEKKS
jgi:hypothetical protein